jgi:heme-degrading monooxygenase HmoA
MTQKIVTIFRSRMNSGIDDVYESWAERTFALASAMPGFLSIKTFTAEDGERVSIVEFASEEAHNAWRNHPVHQAAQKLGREKFYSEYKLQVCTMVREYGKAPK